MLQRMVLLKKPFRVSREQVKPWLKQRRSKFLVWERMHHGKRYSRFVKSLFIFSLEQPTHSVTWFYIFYPCRDTTTCLSETQRTEAFTFNRRFTEPKNVWKLHTSLKWKKQVERLQLLHGGEHIALIFGDPPCSYLWRAFVIWEFVIRSSLFL